MTLPHHVITSCTLMTSHDLLYCHDNDQSYLLIRTQFTLKELQKRPLPEGVDPSLLETYITDEEFQVRIKNASRQIYRHLNEG